MSDYTKVLSVIRSCKTLRQNELADVMIDNYENNEYRKIRVRGGSFDNKIIQIAYVGRIMAEIRNENDRIFSDLCKERDLNE